MNPLKDPTDALTFRVFNARIIPSLGRVLAKPEKGLVIVPRSGLTGVGKVLKEDNSVRTALTTLTLALGSSNRRLRDNGIMVGSPWESLETQGPLSIKVLGSGDPEMARIVNRRDSLRYWNVIQNPLNLTNRTIRSLRRIRAEAY